MAETEEESDKEQKSFIAKSATEVQRLKLEKLMKNPVSTYMDKLVTIPERPKEKNTPHVPEFVRNVMGSSAGAGSGEFHVYRHLRRKEYARQKFIQEKAEKELLEEAYHRKLEENRQAAEERTAKKRAKRLKKKEKAKQRRKNYGNKKVECIKNENTTDSSESEHSEETSEKQD